MGERRKWLVFVPLAMSLLFAVALWRAEVQWSGCGADDGLVCFPYPLYLRYSLRQRLDFHWLAILPVALTDLLPASLSRSGRISSTTNWFRVSLTLLSCGAVWALLGNWTGKLRDGKRLSEQSRSWLWAVRAIAAAGLLSCGEVYLAVRGGFEGPEMTVAGFAMPFLLILLALTDLGFYPRALRSRWIRALVAAIFTVIFLCVDSAFQEQRRQHEDHLAGGLPEPTGPNTVSIALPFVADPDLEEALAVQAPALLLLAALPGEVSSNGLAGVRVFRAVVVGSYWYVLLGLVMSGVGAKHPWLESIRRAARAALTCALLLVGLGWVAGTFTHPFGLAVGTALPLYGLRASKRDKESTGKLPPGLPLRIGVA